MSRILLASASALVLIGAAATSAIAQPYVDNTTADNTSGAMAIATDNSDNSNAGNDYSNNSDNSDQSNQGNDYSDNSNQGNDYSDNSDNSDNSNQGNDYSDNSDNSSATDSSDNSTNTATVSLSAQYLAGTVTGAPITAEGGDTQGGRVRTGDITADGGSYSGFAGIQTSSNNTGIGSLNQSATALSANANISFGSPPTQ